MNNRIIFVSCGQVTEPEKSLGTMVKDMIDDIPGFEAYFAESVHDVDGLSENVFDALRRCSGAVIILHDRGMVLDASGEEWGNRSSVWINQEIAILAYRKFLEARKLPILVFMDKRVKLEGAMTALIVNPITLGESPETVNTIKTWLNTQSFSAASDSVFLTKWEKLSESSRRVLACLVDQGGDQVKLHAIQVELTNTFSLPKNEASESVGKARGEFISTDLVKFIDNINSGHEFSLHPTWKFELQMMVAKWRASQS